MIRYELILSLCMIKPKKIKLSSYWLIIPHLEIRLNRGFNTFHSLIQDIYSKCILRVRNAATIHLIPKYLKTCDIPRRKMHWFNIEYLFSVRYLPYLDGFQKPNIISIKHTKLRHVLRKYQN